MIHVTSLIQPINLRKAVLNVCTVVASLQVGKLEQ